MKNLIILFQYTNLYDFKYRGDTLRKIKFNFIKKIN